MQTPGINPPPSRLFSVDLVWHHRSLLYFWDAHTFRSHVYNCIVSLSWSLALTLYQVYITLTLLRSFLIYFFLLRLFFRLLFCLKLGTYVLWRPYASNLV